MEIPALHQPTKTIAFVIHSVDLSAQLIGRLISTQPTRTENVAKALFGIKTSGKKKDGKKTEK